MSTAVFESKEITSMQVSNPRQQPTPNNATAESAPPEAVLTQMITGSLGSQAVYVAAKLGIADLLADGPKQVDELASAADADAPSLYRVLRALASCGIFAEQTDRVFDLTPTAELLRSDSPGSLRDLAIFMGEDWHWRVWGQTLYSVRTGKAAWSQVHGKAQPYRNDVIFPGGSASALLAEAQPQGWGLSAVRLSLTVRKAAEPRRTEADTVAKTSPCRRGSCGTAASMRFPISRFTPTKFFLSE